MVYKKSETAGGGATPLGSQYKGSGGIGCVKLLRYYDTKAVRSNRKVGGHSRTDNKIDKGANTNYNSNMMNYNSENKNVSEAHSKPLVPYCLSNLVSSKKIAFTLAEVLITLGIIGIVAALTIPALVSAYRKKMVETRLRKTVSVITEVIKRVEADEGNIDYLFNGVTSADQLTLQREFAQNYILKYLNNAKLCNTQKTEKGRDCLYKTIINGQERTKFNEFVDGQHINKIVLSDGTGFWIQYPLANSTYDYTVTIDLNVSKDKMYNGIDYFQFRLIKNKSKNTYYISSINGSQSESYWEPYLPHCTSDTLSYPDGSKLNWAQLCENPYLDNYYGFGTSFCSSMIECNDWKIPDDYPIKF